MSPESHAVIVAASELQTKLQNATGGIILLILLATVVTFFVKGAKWAVGVLIVLAILAFLAYNIEALGPFGGKLWELLTGVI